MTQECVRSPGQLLQCNVSISAASCKEPTTMQEGEHYCGRLDCEWGLRLSAMKQSSRSQEDPLTWLKANGATGADAHAAAMAGSTGLKRARGRLLRTAGRQTRTRHIARAPRNGGSPCQDSKGNTRDLIGIRLHTLRRVTRSRFRIAPSAGSSVLW